MTPLPQRDHLSSESPKFSPGRMPHGHAPWTPPAEHETEIERLHVHTFPVRAATHGPRHQAGASRRAAKPNVKRGRRGLIDYSDLIIPRTAPPPARPGRRAAVGARAAARARSPAFPLVFYHVFWPFAFPHEAYPRGQESGPPAPRAPRASLDTPSPTRRAALAVTCRAGVVGLAARGRRGPRAAASPASHRPCFTSYTYRY